MYMLTGNDFQAEAGANGLGNVLRFNPATPNSETLTDKGFHVIGAGDSNGSSAYSVKYTVEPRAEVKPEKARRKRKKPGKRGPKGSTCLTWSQVKEVDQFAHLAKREGERLNMFITIRAPKGLLDAKGKRSISRIAGHIGQALQERGQDHIAVMVYEKDPYLHAHLLLHVAQGNRKLIMRRNEGKDGTVHIRNVDDFGPVYITKQREWMGPEFEAKLKRIRRKSVRIEGPRMSFTRAAKALIVDAAWRPVSAPKAHRALSARLVASQRRTSRAG
jgi:hypothetical protein